MIRAARVEQQPHVLRAGWLVVNRLGVVRLSEMRDCEGEKSAVGHHTLLCRGVAAGPIYNAGRLTVPHA